MPTYLSCNLENVLLLNQVTLGGTGKACGVGYPKTGDRVLIGAGATILE